MVLILWKFKDVPCYLRLWSEAPSPAASVAVPRGLCLPDDSEYSSRTSGVAQQQGVSGRWLLGGAWRLPSCHSAAPPAASTLTNRAETSQAPPTAGVVSAPPGGVLQALTFVQNGVGRFVPGHGLLAQVLVGLGQTLHLTEAGVEGHGGVRGVLRHVEVGRSAQLLLDHERLLQQLQQRERRFIWEDPSNLYHSIQVHLQQNWETQTKHKPKQLVLWVVWIVFFHSSILIYKKTWCHNSTWAQTTFIILSTFI